MIFSTLVVVSALVSASATTSFRDRTPEQKLWESFKIKYNKKYDSQEEKTRFGYFLENLKMAEIRNLHEQRSGGSARHGVTKFSDMSQSEFESIFLQADVSQKSKTRDLVKQYEPKRQGLSANQVYDWSGVLSSPVKDQGYCGSCWAFSATEQIESAAMIAGLGSFVLSPEQITQCTGRPAQGCGGGWTEVAYTYVKSAGGLVADADYPYSKLTYEGITGQCTVDVSKAKVAVDSYETLASEDDMFDYVSSTGPVSVCLDAQLWNTYTGGIMSKCGNSVDHCVQVTGVLKGSYWKVRNSWGPDWGEDGYIRLEYGQNTCDITNDPTIVSVHLA